MWYVMKATDTPSSLRRRMTARAAHLAHLRPLVQEGRLLLAGPFPAADADVAAGRAGFLGSLIVAWFDDLKAARDWSDADPYWQAGVYANVDVRPFVKVLPADQASRRDS